MSAQVRRHEHESRLAERLGDVVTGRAAQALLERDALAQHVAVLPVWAWCRSAIPLGRKDLDRASGERLLMPIRLDWETGNVVAVDEPTALRYQVLGLGYEGAGEVLVVPGGERASLPDGRWQLPSVWGAARGVPSSREVLSALVEQGRSAYFALLGDLERKLAHHLLRASVALGAEVHGVADSDSAVAFQVLDDQAREDLLIRMVYGSSDAVASPVQRLIERCLRPGVFARVEPEKYTGDALRRDARDAVRRAAGDSQIGSKIRSMARQHGLGLQHLAEVVSLYREMYPSDRLGVARAREALTLTPPRLQTVDLAGDLVEKSGQPDSETGGGAIRSRSLSDLSATMGAQAGGG